jgi:hypothetical protein
MLEIPNMSDEEQLHRYIAGLKPLTKQHLLINNPATLEDAMNMADRVDTATFEARNQAAANQRRRPNRWGRPMPNFNAGGPAPMELGAMNGPRTKLTPAERQYLIDNNGCFYCRRLGHTLPQCRLRPNNQRRPPAAQQRPQFQRQPKNVQGRRH